MNKVNRTIETIGLKMVRLTSKQPVWVLQPPSWTIQHLEPIARTKPQSNVPVLSRLGIWMIEKSNPLANVQHTTGVIKITLP